MTLKGLFGFASIWQSCSTILEHSERNVVYKQALKHARELGKPLVVVGGEKGRHGTGDLCIDIDPKSCRNAPAFMLADIRSIPMPNKWAGVVFASHVLEHLPTVRDAQIAFAELLRISDFVYVVSPHKWNPTAWLHPGHHLWVSQRGNGLVFKQRQIPPPRNKRTI